MTLATCFFVNFVVSTVFSDTMLREKSARVKGIRLTAVLCLACVCQVMDARGRLLSTREG